MKSPALRHWLDRLACFVVAVLLAFAAMPLLCVVGAYFAKSLIWLPWWAPLLTTGILMIALWAIIARIGGLRRSDLYPWKWIKSPPLALLGVLGASMAVWFRSQAGYPGFAEVRLAPTFLIGLVILVPATLIFGEWLHSTILNPRRLRLANYTPIAGTPPTVGSLVNDQESLLAWVQSDLPIADAKHDLFGMAPIAERVVQNLSAEHAQSLALLGAFGTGKSSILALVHRKLAENEICRAKALILVSIGTWAVVKGKTAEFILSAAIKELSRHFDCSELARLPEHYKAALMGSSGLPRVLAGLLEPVRLPDEELVRLDEFLERHRARLVFFLEDMDRNTDQDILLVELAALLDRLKEFRNITFILAIEGGPATDSVVLRVCDHIDSMPTPSRYDTASLLQKFRRICMDRPGIVFVSNEEENNRIGSFFLPEFSSKPDVQYLIDRFKPPIYTLGSLFTSIRQFKRALRRTYSAWNSLCGEVSLNDLLVICALREVSPTLIQFITESHSSLSQLSGSQSRMESADRQKMLEALDAEWEQIVLPASVNREAVRHMIRLLFPGWRKNNEAPEEIPGQGVAHRAPTDYLHRVLTEHIAPHEIRDQRIFEAINGWRCDANARVLDERTLPETMLTDERVCAILEHFSRLLSAEEAASLISQYYEQCLSLKGKDADRSSCTGYVRVGRIGRRFGCNSEWFRAEIAKAVRVSLGFAEDLLITWNGCLHGQGSGWEIFYREAEAYLRERPERLADIVSNSDIWITHRVFALKPKESTSTIDNGWLAESLLDAATMEPAMVTAQLAPFVASHEMTSEGHQLRYDHSELALLLGSRFPEALRLLVDGPRPAGLTRESAVLFDYARSQAAQTAEYLSILGAVSSKKSLSAVGSRKRRKRSGGGVRRQDNKGRAKGTVT